MVSTRSKTLQRSAKRVSNTPPQSPQPTTPQPVQFAPQPTQEILHIAAKKKLVKKVIEVSKKTRVEDKIKVDEFIDLIPNFDGQKSGPLDPKFFHRVKTMLSKVYSKDYLEKLLQKPIHERSKEAKAFSRSSEICKRIGRIQRQISHDNQVKKREIQLQVLSRPISTTMQKGSNCMITDLYESIASYADIQTIFKLRILNRELYNQFLNRPLPLYFHKERFGNNINFFENQISMGNPRRYLRYLAIYWKHAIHVDPEIKNSAIEFFKQLLELRKTNKYLSEEMEFLYLKYLVPYFAQQYGQYFKFHVYTSINHTNDLFSQPDLIKLLNNQKINLFSAKSIYAYLGGNLEERSSLLNSFKEYMKNVNYTVLNKYC